MTHNQLKTNTALAVLVWAVIYLIASCSSPTHSPDPPDDLDTLVIQRPCNSCHEWDHEAGLIPDRKEE